MTPKTAAEIIGMSPAQMRQACRKGLIPARKMRLNNGDPNAFIYSLRIADVLWYRDNRPKRGPKPRGRDNGKNVKTVGPRSN